MRAGWTLARLRIRRALNATRARRSKPGERKGTQQKSRSGILIPIFLVVFAAIFVLWGLNAATKLGAAVSDRALLLDVFGVMLAALMIYQVVLQLSARGVSQVEWDMEWLSTVPLPRAAIFGAKIVERTLVAWSTLLIGGTLLAGITHAVGRGRTLGYALGVIGALAMSLTAASLGVLAETWLRVRLPPSRRQNLQATIGIFGAFILLPIYLLPQTPALLEMILPYAPYAHGLPTRALAVAARSANPVAFLRFLAWMVALCALAIFTLLRLTRFGIDSGGVRQARSDGSARKPIRFAEGRAWLTPVQRRDLLLIARDRTLLVQMVLLPLLIVAQQAFLNSKFLDGSPSRIGTAAFLAGAYALAFSGLQILATDGRGLWLTLSQPISFERLLRQKTLVSLAIAGSIAVLTFAIFARKSSALTASHLSAFLLALLGIALYAIIATSLGVFAFDPIATEPGQRLKQQYLMLYFALTGFFAYAIAAQSFWSQLVLIVLTFFLALSLWQKAREQLPYFFDPSSAPERAITLADGIMALMGYFVLQTLFMLMFAHWFAVPAPLYVAAASAHAAGIVWALMWVMVTRKQRASMLTLKAPALYALIAPPVGLALAFAAARYGQWALPFFSDEPASAPSTHSSWYLACFAVAVAPLAEEYLFRGVLLAGLRRELAPAYAVMANAALFAVVHPPMSVAPVFVVGVCCATLAIRSRSLLPGVLLHMTYNATLLWLAR